jgi:hypothetical protein
MMRKKDKKGRWVKRVQGEYSDKVFSMRLTGSEYQLVKRARAEGLEPRRVLIDTLQDKLKDGGSNAKG